MIWKRNSDPEEFAAVIGFRVLDMTGVAKAEDRCHRKAMFMEKMTCKELRALGTFSPRYRQSPMRTWLWRFSRKSVGTKIGGAERQAGKSLQ
jgi:hypothetical protein